jgi:peroxiredoxin
LSPKTSVKFAVVIIVLLVVVSGLFTQLKLLTARTSGTAKQNSISQEDPLNAGPKVGEKAPDLTLPDLNGREYALSSFRGKPVVLGFFCGCDRCHTAALKISAMQKRGKLRNFVAVVAMDTDGAKEFRRSTGLQGTILIDPSDKTAERWASAFCPRLWELSANGTIAYRSTYALEGTELNSALEILSQSPTNTVATRTAKGQ